MVACTRARHGLDEARREKQTEAAQKGCDEIYHEKVCGKSIKNWPELEEAIDLLGTGDTLAVAEWDRGARSMVDGTILPSRLSYVVLAWRYQGFSEDQTSG